MNVITANIGFVVTEDDERLGVFETRPQAEWFVRTGETLSAAEAAFAQEAYMSKIDLAKAIIFQAQLLARPMDEAGDVLQEYFDSGVTFTDEDVAALGVTAAQIVACLTLLENVVKFFGGNTPANAAYRVTVNAVRRV
jgi:hypothetical protein